MEHFRVLIVDDSLVIRAMMTNVLEKDRQIEVIGAAADAAEADRILASGHPDVVTLDINMPGISGLDYLETLKQQQIPVIMLSGQTSEGSDVRGAALMMGASACFNKARAVDDAPTLIKLVKAAASGKVRLGTADTFALARARARLAQTEQTSIAHP